MIMKLVNIYDAKARLSEYLELVAQGERVLICRRNEPVAELRAVSSVRTDARPLGGTVIDLPPAFFEPLPDEVTSAFYGGTPSGTSRAAEPHGAGTTARPSPRKRKKARRA